MNFRYNKFKPSEYVMVIKKGRPVRKGKGLSVFYNNLITNLVVIPATAFDGAFAFEDLITADFQEVCVQGGITYRIFDFDKASLMADFTYNPRKKDNSILAMAVINKRINNIIKAIVIREVGVRDVRTIIKQADEMAQIITDMLKDDEIIAGLGVEIITVNVLGIMAKPETRKALEAAAREQILKEQDDAIYMRRNAAIEQERLIKENELNTEIKVAEKEQEKQDKEQEMMLSLQRSQLAREEEKQDREQEMELKLQRGQLEREQEKQSKKQQILREEMEARLERQMIEAEKKGQLEKQEMEYRIELEEKNKDFLAIELENEKLKNDEKARAMAAMIKAYENMNVALVEACALANMDPNAIMAKGFMQLGQNADKIGTLNIGTDILDQLVGKLEK
ncbi:MAG: hypothetical protein K6E10_03240 [Eubacterium sp.]|nr:hypothetical protein [Eubacterium sp.]